jgi:6-phosphogluconolactonase
MQMDASGKFLYLASASDGSLVTLGINRKSGDLKILGRVPSGSSKPNQIRIEPGGRYVFALDQASNRVVVFEIEPKTGLLTATSQFATVPEPTGIQFSAVVNEGIH